MDRLLKAIGVLGEFNELVVAATIPAEDGGLDVNWEKVLEICDLMNLTIQNGRELLKTIRKRLTNTDKNICYLTLVVVETMIKNGGRSFHMLLSSTPDLLKEISIIAASSEDHISVEHARKLVLALSLFSHGRRELKGFTAMATHTELAEYRKTTITEDWRTVTGPGTAGIKSDPKSYQEISPRAPPETHVVRTSEPREVPPEGLHARVDPVVISPRRDLPDEIRKIWTDVNLLKAKLLDINRGRECTETAFESLTSLADDIRNGRCKVTEAASHSTNTSQLTYLLELSDTLNATLGEFDRFVTIYQTGESNNKNSEDSDETEDFLDATPREDSTPSAAPQTASDSNIRLDLEQVLNRPTPHASTPPSLGDFTHVKETKPNNNSAAIPLSDSESEEIETFQPVTMMEPIGVGGIN